MYKRLSYYLPNLAQCWLLVLLFAVVGTVGALLLCKLITLAIPAFAKWEVILSYPLTFVPVALFIFVKTRREYSEAASQEVASPCIPLNNPNFGSIGPFLSFLMLIPLIFAFNIVTEPLSSWIEVPKIWEEIILSIHDNKIGYFISIVILAPLLEELLCRGVIMRGLLYHLSPVKAIVWSAVIFGVLHLNPWQAVPAFLTGSLMGWLYWKSGSIWVPIFVHFVNNAFSYLITVLFSEIPIDAGFADIIPAEYYYFIYFASLLTLVALLFLMNRKYDKPVSVEI